MSVRHLYPKVVHTDESIQSGVQPQLLLHFTQHSLRGILSFLYSPKQHMHAAPRKNENNERAIASISCNQPKKPVTIPNLRAAQQHICWWWALEGRRERAAEGGKEGAAEGRCVLEIPVRRPPHILHENDFAGALAVVGVAPEVLHDRTDHYRATERRVESCQV